MFRGWLTFLLLVSSAALADPVTPSGGASAKQHAAELATESTQHYKRGEFEVSVALLREAYALYPEPNLLYNLGRSLEGMGDTKGAIEAYDSYLATGKDIEDRGAIERRVATLKSELVDKQQHDAAPVVAPPPVVVAPPPVAVVQPAQPLPPPHDEAAPSKLPWIAMIAGVAVLGGGITYGELALNRHNEANEASTSGLAASSLQSDATHYATIANVMFAVGGVVLAGGLVWEIYEHRAHGSNVAVRARVGPGGFALDGTFP